MKSGFSKEITYVPDALGNRELPEAEQVKAKLQLMTVGDVLEAVEALSAHANEDGKVDLSQQKAFVSEGKKYLLKYVTIVGAEDFTLEDVVSYGRFMPLAVDIFQELLKVSQPSEQDVKN